MTEPPRQQRHHAFHIIKRVGTIWCKHVSFQNPQPQIQLIPFLAMQLRPLVLGSHSLARNQLLTNAQISRDMQNGCLGSCLSWCQADFNNSTNTLPVVIDGAWCCRASLQPPNLPTPEGLGSTTHSESFGIIRTIQTIVPMAPEPQNTNEISCNLQRDCLGRCCFCRRIGTFLQDTWKCVPSKRAETWRNFAVWTNLNECLSL